MPVPYWKTVQPSHCVMRAWRSPHERADIPIRDEETATVMQKSELAWGDSIFSADGPAHRSHYCFHGAWQSGMRLLQPREGNAITA